MKYQKLLYFLQNVGKDPAALIYEDELTGLNNRRFLLSFFKHKIDWNTVRQSPVSLLIIDIDHFKRIKDQYGTNAGDQVLLHIAGQIESAAGDDDVVVRYAGNQFALLLPGRPKAEALETAGKLISGIHNSPFFLPEAGKQIPVTLSIGVATAPNDAESGKLLINQADTALYHARSSGGDLCADAATVSRQAIRYIDSAGVIGRKSHFEQVSAALKKVSTGKSQFVIIDGAPGMGKTSFLDTVQRNLEKTTLKPVRVSGVFQESFRPYYLVSYAVIVLMNQLHDKGISVLESMDKTDRSYLPYIMPQLSDEDVPLTEKNVPEEKDAIFGAFKRFLAKLIGARPLVLLIDDLQFSDPASLDMIRELLLDDLSLLFICATASLEKNNIPQAIPLELFRTAYSEPLGIQEIVLTPLTADDIGKYMNIVFPKIAMPRDLTRELAELTQGNPLFIISILRKMISDQKIIQSEKQWAVAKLEKGYFPRSFEEIVQQKLAGMNGDGKKFLDRASAFGESTSLSVLAGFSDQKSTEIYDIIKDAVDNGIVSSEFDEDDENIRFSSKRVREVIYDGIQPEERKRIHTEIGHYQEKLYHQNILPSAAFLVHHFKQSDNEEKARTYEQLMSQFNQRIYDFSEENQAPGEETIEEEDSYAGEAEKIADFPLSEEGLRHVPNLLRALIVAIRNTRLYPPESKSVTGATGQLMNLVQSILKSDERISLISEKNLLLVNGQIVDTSAFQSVADKIVEIWNRMELKSITITEGATLDEIRAVLEKISQIERRTITPGFWRRFMEEKRLVHVLFRQVKYKKINAQTGSSLPNTGVPEATDMFPAEGDRRFEPEELKAIQKVLGTLLGAYSKLKLYPAKGPVAGSAVNQVMTELHSFLRQWPILSVARVENALLINGLKIDTSGFETVVGGFLKLLVDTGLNSISFTPRVSANELIEFLATAAQSTGGEINTVFWKKLAAERQITGILFDQSIYGIIEAQIGTIDMEFQAASGNVAFAEAASMTSEEVESIDTLDDNTLPDRLRELFLGGNIRGAEALLQELTNKYRNADKDGKIRITDIFNVILNPPDWRPNAHFVKMIIKPLLDLLDVEEDPEPADRLFILCHRSGEGFILFGEYTLATWVYSRLRQHAENRDTPLILSETHIFGRPVGPAVTDAITEDLKSDDRLRQQEAYQLISSLGNGMLPLLTDIVKREENLRVRRMAAELLKHSGPLGVEAIKESVRGGIRPDERARILDVIDTVTDDLEPELALAFSHINEAVRRSAFRLAERLNTPEVIKLLNEIALNDDTQQAVFAINTLGKLRTPSLIETLLRILRESEDPEILIAACRALGQIGDAASVEPLYRILVPRRRFLRRKKYDTPVRVAAAYALAQISDDRANDILQKLKNDPDSRIRQVVSRYHPEKN